MKTVQHAIEVAVPLHTAFEQLSHFENYPQFMTGIKQVTQLSDTKAHWVMELNGQRQEFDAEITECREDERVAWKSSGTPMLSEVITLRAKGDNRTHITAQLAADAQALLPSDAHAEESLSKLLKADLNRFKQYAEQHPSGVLPQSATARNISDPNGIAGTDTADAAAGGTKSAKGARGGNSGKSARSATASPADLAQNAGSRSASGSSGAGSGIGDSDFETAAGTGRSRSASGSGTASGTGDTASSGSGQIRGAQADNTTGSSGSKSRSNSGNRRSNT